MAPILAKAIFLHLMRSVTFCRMSSRLLGPGGAFLDLQLVVSPSNFAFTFRASIKGGLHFSRPDLVLGNRVVFSLISRVFVASGEMDGGHSPVLVELRNQSAWALPWRAPRPRLPDWLYAPSRDLKALDKWKDLRQQWMDSPAMIRLAHHPPIDDLHSLSTLLEAAMQEFVRLAGGWVFRGPNRRPAYTSQRVGRTRALFVFFLETA